MKSSQHPRHILVLIVSVVLMIMVGVALLSQKPARAVNPPPAPAPIPHFVDVNAPGAPRILVIAAASKALPGVSNSAGVLMANLYDGSIPADAKRATVLSDANCAPDADGISHCLNELNIDGTIVTVQHHHAMAETPCLSPGETITLMTYAEYEAGL